MKKWIIVTLLSAVFIVLEFLSPMDFQTGELQPDLLEPPTEILKSAVCNNGRIAVGYDSQENLLFYQTLDIEMTSPDILLDLSFFPMYPEDIRLCDIRIFHLRDSVFLPCTPKLCQENDRQRIYEFGESFQNGDILRLQVLFPLGKKHEPPMEMACYGPSIAVTQDLRQVFSFPMGFTDLQTELFSPGKNKLLFEDRRTLILRPFEF